MHLDTDTKYHYDTVNKTLVLQDNDDLTSQWRPHNNEQRCKEAALPKNTKTKMAVSFSWKEIPCASLWDDLWSQCYQGKPETFLQNCMAWQQLQGCKVMLSKKKKKTWFRVGTSICTHWWCSSDTACSVRQNLSHLDLMTLVYNRAYCCFSEPYYTDINDMLTRTCQQYPDRAETWKTMKRSYGS